MYDSDLPQHNDPDSPPLMGGKCYTVRYFEPKPWTTRSTSGGRQMNSWWDHSQEFGTPEEAVASFKQTKKYRIGMKFVVVEIKTAETVVQVEG